MDFLASRLADDFAVLGYFGPRLPIGRSTED